MPLSRGRILLIGCLAAVGVAVAAVFVAWLLLARWIQQPAPPLDGLRLADLDTAAYLDVVLRREDPGARALMRDLLLATRDTSALPPQVPRWLRGVIDRAGSQPPTDKEIDQLLPLRLVGTVSRPSAEAFGPPLVAVNSEGAGRMFRVMDTLLSLVPGRDGDLQRFDYQGARLYRVPLRGTPLWLAVAGTDLLVSRDEEATRRALDRLRPGAGPGPDWLRDALAAMPPEAVLRVATTEDRPASLAGLIPEDASEWRAALEPALASAGAVSLWARLPDSETLRGEVRLRNRSPGPDDSSYALTLPLADGPLSVRVEPRPAAGAWEIEIRGVGTGLQSIVRLFRRSLPEGIPITGR